MSEAPHSTSEKTALPLTARIHFFAPWLLVVFAAIYYGLYYRSGLNLGGEGGTVAVVAQRLIAGERPIADVFLGYNLLWFYPVVWLFKIFGPNYIALRIFFFVLCTITGLLAYRIVWRVTARPLYALIPAIILIYVPGMIFRNYMALIGVLNILVLLEAYVLTQKNTRTRLLWIAGAAATLALTFLVRVEVGFFMVPIYLGLMALYLVGPRKDIYPRLLISIYALLITGFIFVLIHLPFYLDARKRGFAENFTGQYEQIPNMLRHQLQQYVSRGPVQPSLPSVNPGAAQTVTAPPPPTPAADPGTRPRPSLKDFQRNIPFLDKLLAFNLYLPIFLAGIMAAGAALGFLLSLAKEDGVLRGKTLSVLIATGCALTFFPQYYFFRPDLPHLCEFMSPFIVALALCGYFAWQWLLALRSPLWRILPGCFLAVAITDAFSYVYHADKKPSAGTAAARRFRTVEFRGENGVHVLLQLEEATQIQGIHDAIMAHSAPEDYVACYPYSPTVNFMTDRRSYLYNLYVDNATAPKKFHATTLEEIEKYRPAAILIDNRAINKTEGSRFSNWAADTYQFIRQHYRLAGKFGENEVYVRPDKIQPSQP